MSKPVAYIVECNMRHPSFRRVKRVFRPGQPQTIAVEELTEVELTHLLSSSPKDLIIKPVVSVPPAAAPPPPVASPTATQMGPASAFDLTEGHEPAAARQPKGRRR